MGKKFSLILISVIALAILIIFSGCIQQPVCPNGICETGETAQSCPQDCPPKVCPASVSIQTDKETYEPGNSYTVSIQTLDSKGNGIATEFSLETKINGLSIAKGTMKTDDNGKYSATGAAPTAAGEYKLVVTTLTPSPCSMVQTTKTVTIKQKTQNHTECQNLKCVIVSGDGTNKCAMDSDCSHKECVNQTCSVVQGTGLSTCFTNADCMIVPGLESHYSFEGNYRDYGLKNCEGAGFGNVSFVNGKIGKAIALSGDSSYVFLGNCPSGKDIGMEKKDFTITLWEKTSSSNFQVIYSQIWGGGQRIFMENGKIKWQMRDDSGENQLSSNTAINDNAWHHLAMVRNSTGIKLYIDSVLDSSLAMAPKNVDNVGDSNRVCIGGDKLGPTYAVFNGAIDEFRLYSTALSQQEIIENYNYNPGTCIDRDSDGYGSPGNSSCTKGSQTDCDDKNPSIYPGAPEILCDGIDQDCDGVDKCLECNGQQCPTCNIFCRNNGPGGYVGYNFEHTGFNKMEVIFNWANLPKVNDVGIYPALMHFGFQAAGQGGGYTGPQYELSNGKKIKKVIFSIWSMNNIGFTAQPVSSWCTYGDSEGNFVQCMIRSDGEGGRPVYAWEEGKDYRVAIQKDQEVSDGAIWKATITDVQTGQETLIGKIKLKDQAPYKGYGLLTGAGGFFEYYFGGMNKCLDAEYGKIIRKGPIADNSWLARKGQGDVQYCYRANATMPTIGTIIEEIGKGTFRTVKGEPERLETIPLWQFDHDIACNLDGKCDASEDKQKCADCTG